MARLNALILCVGLSLVADAMSPTRTESIRAAARQQVQISAAADVEQTSALGADVPSTSESGAGVLAVISHWQNVGKDFQTRIDALNRTVRAIRSFGVPTKILVATNAHFEYFADIGVEHVAYKKPMCNRTFQSNLCMPWQAIKLLRGASSTANISGCWLDVMGACGPPSFDFYMYMEDDIEIPASTFNFFRKHASSLYKRNFLLVPLRVEPKTSLLSDCFDNFGSNCSGMTCPIVDKGPSSLYSTESEKVYLKMSNPYSASFMMNKEQFIDYLQSREWDFDRTMTYTWGKPRISTLPLLHGLNFDPREGAASGLLGAYPSWGLRRYPITSPHMLVHHQVTMFGENILFDNLKLDMIEAKVAPCVQDPTSCLSLLDVEKCPHRLPRAGWFTPIMPNAKPHWSRR